MKGNRYHVPLFPSQAEVEAAISEVIQAEAKAEGGIDCEATGMVVLSGIPIIYRLYLVDVACLVVNVGTYFPL